MTPVDFFSSHFQKLKALPPYPWQRKLFQEIISGNRPEVIDMPTGAGKTSLLWIWWLALAWSRQQSRSGIPLRLAWVVNRRVVVDQITDEVNELCLKWGRLGNNLLPAPFVSTLRGQLADKGDWLHDPSRPAVIVGTADMIGSRLLFRGYRSSPYWRPIETGLLGVDTLIVNDEAHLSPAFAQLLAAIHQMRPADNIPGKVFRHMLLSATQVESQALRFIHDPHEDAVESHQFQTIWTASKQLHLRELPNGPAMKAEMWKIVTQTPAPRTIVFIEKPEEALKFHRQLTNEGFPAALLTGTMRGQERDDLAERNSIFQCFRQRDPSDTPVFLVATSAAEVGVNLTCERMLTNLCETDHLIQRFGRMNRFGATSDGLLIQSQAWVVYVALKKEAKPRLEAALVYLRTLHGDVSPKNLWSNPPPESARTEPAKTARMEKWRIESWALTTLPDRYLPRVESWLRGQQDEEPTLEVAWRVDLQYLLAWNLPANQIERMLETFPVLPKEKLQEPSSLVLEKLNTITGQLERRLTKILVVDQDLSVTIRDIQDLSEDDIKYRLLLLPPGIGRVGEHGMFEPEANEGVPDVAANDERIRLLFRDGQWRYIGTAPANFPEVPQMIPSRQDIAAFAKDNDCRAPLILKNPQDESDEVLVYLTMQSAKKARALKEVSLKDHREKVAFQARRIALDAGLSEEMAARFHKAAMRHDEGKDHALWQRAMGAKAPPAAKTVSASNLALLNGYRHEFGSLLKSKDVVDDLVLHLIAAHHANGRPFFNPNQFDPEEPEEECLCLAREAEKRFARLQSEFGPWGLAYLEAIFKRADGLASADEGGGASE